MPFRAPIVTPKPLVHGIQTAKVVTKDDSSSEEIDVEELTEIYVLHLLSPSAEQTARRSQLGSSMMRTIKTYAKRGALNHALIEAYDIRESQRMRPPASTAWIDQSLWYIDTAWIAFLSGHLTQF